MSDRGDRLSHTITTIQKRWGRDAIGRLRTYATTPSCLSTSFAALDQALGGGLPHGRISEIIGIPTSGTATLALKLMATAQAERGTAVYLDLDHTFDPDYADRCGVALQRLILVHPRDVTEALSMLPDLIDNAALAGGINILVVDLPLGRQPDFATTQALARVVGRLIAPLSRTDCVLLFLTALPPGSPASLDAYPAQTALPHYAAVRLLVHKARWLYQRRDVAGYEAEVLVAKNKLAAAGKQVRIALTSAQIATGRRFS